MVDAVHMRGAHALATELDERAKVNIIDDTKFEERANDLIRETVEVVSSGGTLPRRMKRGAGAWVDGHKYGTRAGRDFYVFTVGVGAVVCVAGAAAFAAIGWWALLPGIPVGLGTYFLGKLVSSKWTKHSALAAIKDTETLGRLRQPSLDDGKLAECILGVVLSEYKRLLEKKDKYFSDSTRAAQWRIAAAEAYNEAKAMDAGRNISGGWFSRLRGAGLRGSGDDAQALQKGTILIRRTILMIAFVRAYIRKLQEKIDAELKPYLDTVDDVVSRAVLETVKVGKHHIGCPDSCCYGPAESDLQLRPVPEASQTVAAAQTRIDLAREFTVTRNVRLTGGAKEKVDRLRNANALMGTPIAAASEARASAHDFFVDSDAVIDGAQGVAFGAATEGMESLLPEVVQAAAGGAGADLAMGPVGLVLGIAVGEIVQSIKVNRPTARAAAKIYDATADDADRIENQLKEELGKASNDILERALSKVHSHYLDRIHARLTKLQNDPAVIQLRNNQNIEITCADASNLTRYVHKCWHYVIKAESHLAFVKAAMDNLERDLKRQFPGA